MGNYSVANEKIRKTAKRKLIVMALSTLLPVVLLILFDLPFFKERFVVYKDLVFLRYVIFIIFEGYIFFKIYRYVRILTSEDYLNSYRLIRNDERLNFIKLKTNAMVIKILIYVCGIAIITAGFFNAFVFYTLLSVLGVLLIIYISVFIYFNKKY